MDNKKKIKTVVLVFLLLVVCIAVTAVICLNISKNKGEENTPNEQSSVDANKVNENVEKTEELVKEDVETEKSDETSKETTSNTSTNDSLRSKYPDVVWATNTDTNTKTGFKFRIDGTKLFSSSNSGGEYVIDIEKNLKSVKGILMGGMLYAYTLTENGEVYSVNVVENSKSLVDKLKNNKIIDIGYNSKNNIDPICFLTSTGELINRNGNEFVTTEDGGKNLRSKYPNVKWATETDTHRLGYTAKVEGTYLVYSDRTGNETRLDLSTELKSVKIYLSGGIISAYVLSTSGHVYKVLLVEKEFWDVMAINVHYIIDIGDNQNSGNEPFCFLTNEGILVDYQGIKIE